jgi:hypothetical protein
MTNLYIPWYGGYVNVGVVMYDPDQPGVYTAARVDINNNCDFKLKTHTGGTDSRNSNSLRTDNLRRKPRYT